MSSEFFPPHPRLRPKVYVYVDTNPQYKLTQDDVAFIESRVRPGSIEVEPVGGDADDE